MIGEFRDDRFVRRVRKQSIGGGPHEHVQRSDERDVHQQPRPKRLRMETHFLEQPSTEILQRENVTTPATNETPEDQRRYNCQTKKDEARVDESLLNVCIVSEGSIG